MYNTIHDVGLLTDEDKRVNGHYNYKSNDLIENKKDLKNGEIKNGTESNLE